MAVLRNTQERVLCLRATFIDVEGPAAEGQRLARARSEEPRVRGSMPKDAALEAERRYVQQLSGALAALGSAPAARRHLGGAPRLDKAAKADLASLATTAVPDDALSAFTLDSGLDAGLGELPAVVPAPLPSSSRRTRRAAGGAPVAGRSNTSLAVLLMRGKAGGEPAARPEAGAAEAPEEPEVPAAAAARAAASPDSSSRLSWADESELPEAAVVPAVFGCSLGSTGHPDLCNRPCMYVTTLAGCQSGEQCEYCHMEHGKRAPHLDKRHREMLRNLSAVEWATGIIPILTKKVQAVDSTGDGLALVGQICRRMGLPEGLESSTPLRHQRMMILTLRAMTLKTLISTIQRNLHRCDEVAGDLCRALLEHLLAQVLKN